jgi:hypothetical protein
VTVNPHKAVEVDEAEEVEAVETVNKPILLLRSRKPSSASIVVTKVIMSEAARGRR